MIKKENILSATLEPNGVDDEERPKPDRSNPQAESAIGQAPPLPPREVRDPLKWGI